MPQNFRQLVFCISPLQAPELIPGIESYGTRFTLKNVINGIADEDPIARSSKLILAVPTAALWFGPGWLYRFTLKSTVWLWWPMAFLGANLKRARNPEEFRRTTFGSLWAKSNIAMSCGVLIAFVWFNIMNSADSAGHNPFITVFGYFFVIDWSFRPWPLLSVVLATISVILVFSVDDASGQYRIGAAEGDTLLVNRANRKFAYIEILARVRLLIFIALTLVVGVHAVLYLNSLECWFTLPNNTARWGQWVYGDRMPEMMCSELAGPSS